MTETGASWPARLGAFEIAGVLGEGGSAIVYDARMNDLAIALKVSRHEAERNRARFLEEARLMKRVPHPAMVEVLEADVLPDGRPYLALERLEGETLAERLARGALPFEQALALFDQLTEALEAVHEAGLLHRDLKPENILLIDGGQNLKLLDLGIAKDVKSGPSTTTQAGIVRGTPATMAPERILGKPATESSEVYELALLLYAMLAGRLPWVTEDVESRLNPPSLIDAGAAVPAGLSAVLMQALSTRPERRPATVGELALRVREEARSDARVERMTRAMPDRSSETKRSGSLRMAVALALLVGSASLAYAAARSERSARVHVGLARQFALPQKRSEPGARTPVASSAAPSAPAPRSARAAVSATPTASVEATPSPDLHGGVYGKPPYRP